MPAVRFTKTYTEKNLFTIQQTKRNENFMEKISVIVPFGNNAKTLDRCISSIISQTYENFELIAVSDGSTDASCGIIRKYAANDKRIKLFEKAHGGVSSARNFGLDRAEGDFIQFIDADDYIEPEMFELAVAKMKETGADMVVVNHTHPCIINYLGDAVIDMTSKDGARTFYQNTFASLLPWNKLWKRSAITDRFDETTNFCEDDLFCLANIKNTKKIASIGKVLYNYYCAPPSTSLEESSAINKMAKAPDFWITKKTFWYMRNALRPASRKIIEKHFEKDERDTFEYIRIFDFMLWEIAILGAMDVDECGLTKEMQNIFAEEDFHKSMRLQERYGIRFTAYSTEGRDKKVAEFINLCLRAIYDIRENGKDLKPYHVILDIFAEMFTEITGPLDTVNFAAKAALEMSILSTDEARYAKNLVSKRNSSRPRITLRENTV